MRSYVATALAQLFPALGLTCLLAVPVVSHAHANLVSPPPRDGSSGYKDPQGPCGPPPHTAPTMYRVGQKVAVSWVETVYHPGCFLVDFSPANDQNWQTLATVTHDAKTAAPINYMTQVTLPQGVSCTACTLRVRQIMLAAQGACPPADIQPGDTYYSCGDIVIGSVQQPPDLGETTTPDLGTTADAGSAGAMVSGCHAAPAQVAAGSLSGLALLAGSALLLFRRRRPA